MPFSNNVNDVDKTFTKIDLLGIIEVELIFLEIKKTNDVLIFDKDRIYSHYFMFRYCLRTKRLQYRFEGEYNFRLLQNATKEELVIMALNVLTTTLEMY